MYIIQRTELIGDGVTTRYPRPTISRGSTSAPRTISARVHSALSEENAAMCSGAKPSGCARRRGEDRRIPFQTKHVKRGNRAGVNGRARPGRGHICEA